ncbi:MAG: hypothetical protein E7289_04085 [Lachnospiraceae bacterium]|nr:hypothetical protein [Lachnospiraceae bacterium]
MTLWDIYEKSSVFKLVEGGEIGKENASLFVCGIVLKELFCPQIGLQYPKTDWSWEQLWYLLCLHHDRRFEQRTLWKLACQQGAMHGTKEKWEARNIETETDWGPMQLFFSPVFEYDQEGIRFTNGACIKESPVSETEVKDMFFFRNTCSGKVGMDHGIAGGLLLYENLLFKHWEEKGEIKEEQLKLYSYLANVLIVHHFLQKREEASPEKNPLLYLLLLAEAVEPLHYVKDGDRTRSILKSVEVEVRVKEIVLRTKKSKIPFEEYVSCVTEAADKTGMQCIFRADLSEIRMKMCESPIIDELFI